MTPSVRRISTMLLAGSAAALTASVAQAQDQASTPAAADAPAVDKGDIVVTARRRDETAQRIPISIGVVYLFSVYLGKEHENRNGASDDNDIQPHQEQP